MKPVLFIALSLLQFHAAAQSPENVIQTATGGSAFFIAPDRLMTAYHAIAGDGPSLIKYGGVYYRYAVRSVDRNQDVAVIQIAHAVCKNPLTVKKTRPTTGSLVTAFGWRYGALVSASGVILQYDSPFVSAEYGVVACFARTGVKTSANIKPGYSGGPVMYNGYVIGVATNYMHYSSLCDVRLKK